MEAAAAPLLEDSLLLALGSGSLMIPVTRWGCPGVEQCPQTAAWRGI